MWKKREKHHIQLKVFFQHYWTNRPTVGTLGPVHKVLLITSWQWESLESRRVCDQADLIMIIGIHQLQITLMERDFSDQEHIFDCRSKFTFSFFFFFFMGRVIMQHSGCVPNRPESECAFSSAFGSDIHRRKRRVTALTSISPASE